MINLLKLDIAKMRWRIERDYQELKQEIGLGHYEGRGWPGFHHRADDVAMVGQAVEQRGGHLGFAEDARRFAEGEVGADDDRGALVEPADEVEQELAAGLRRCSRAR
jgi:hypothetical protein